MAYAYELRISPRARSMRVSVFADGAVRVTVPKRFSSAALEKFMQKYGDWIEKHVAKTSGGTVIHAQKSLIAEYKRAAHALAILRCEHFAKQYGVSYGSVSIRAQKTRWGSCSKAGNLSFNYKIALLPERLVDYVIVHELCHRKEFNHSSRFWAEVERAIPEHRALRKELRALVFRFA